MDLAFLVDMLCHLDRLNLTLQGKLKMMPDLVQSVFAFVNKLNMFKTQFQRGDLAHFPPKSPVPPWIRASRYGYVLVENLHEIFVTRFCDLQLKRPQITFLVDLFNAEKDSLKAPLVTDEATAEAGRTPPGKRSFRVSNGAPSTNRKRRSTCVAVQEVTFQPSTTSDETLWESCILKFIYFTFIFDKLLKKGIISAVQLCF